MAEMNWNPVSRQGETNKYIEFVQEDYTLEMILNESLKVYQFEYKVIFLYIYNFLFDWFRAKSLTNILVCNIFFLKLPTETLVWKSI